MYEEIHVSEWSFHFPPFEESMLSIIIHLMSMMAELFTKQAFPTKDHRSTSSTSLPKRGTNIPHFSTVKTIHNTDLYHQVSLPF